MTQARPDHEETRRLSDNISQSHQDKNGKNWNVNKGTAQNRTCALRIVMKNSVRDKLDEKGGLSKEREREREMRLVIHFIQVKRKVEKMRIYKEEIEIEEELSRGW